MKVEAFQEYMTRKGYKMAGQVACGLEEEFPVLVSYKGPKLWEIAFSVDSLDWKKLRKELNQSIKGNGGGAVYANGRFTINFTVRDMDVDTAYPAVIHTTCDILRAQGVQPKKNCAICKQSGCDALVYYKGEYQPVHGRCYASTIDKAKEAVEKNDLNGNYFLGIIGGLLGAIVGVIPSVFSILMVEKIYAVLFALIPICIYYGYKLFKGKLNKVALVITIVLSIFGVYFLEIILLLITVVTEYGATVGEAFIVVGAALTSGEAWSLMTQDSIMSFIFVALGIWFSWGYISNTNKSMLQSVEAQRATLTPYMTGDSASFNVTPQSGEYAEMYGSTSGQSGAGSANTQR